MFGSLFESKAARRKRELREKAEDVATYTLASALALVLVDGVKAAWSAASVAIAARKAKAPVAAIPAAAAPVVAAPKGG